MSGPILDRFDVVASVPRVAFETIREPVAESSADVRERVVAARALQTKRLGVARTNATMLPRELERYAAIDADTERLLADAVDRWHLSVRGYHRVLKVARTIADLAGSAVVTERHVAEALQYRHAASPVAA